MEIACTIHCLLAACHAGALAVSLQPETVAPGSGSIAAFAVLADRRRRRLLELLPAADERSS